MRHRHVAIVVLALAMAWTAAGVAQQTAQEQYQAALYQEQVQGDLQRAITLYQRILTDGSADRAVAAKAQLHVGLCYETLGRAEAQRAYERVISEYADQAAVVSEARSHLAALQPAVGRGPVARRLLSGDDTDINNLMIVTPSPDGQVVAYTHLGSDQALCVRDLATGEERCLASGLPQVMNFSPVWSPDGKRLAFLSADMTTGSGEIKIVDVASKAVTTAPRTRTENQDPRRWFQNLTPVDWSRDGRYLLCRTAARATAVDPKPVGLVLVPVAGGDRIALADSVASQSPAALSPDGRFVAYVAGASGSAQVFVRPATAGGEPRAITDTPGGNGSPQWSPDGRALAYTRSDGIWVAPMENGRPTGTPKLAYASASTDKMAFAWTETGGLYFASWANTATPYRFSVDAVSGSQGTEAPERLPGVSGTASVFAWSPDMSRIAFVGYNSPDVSVYSTDRRALASYRLDPAPWHFRVGWSSDGREVLYQGRRNPAGVNWLAFDPSTGHVRELIPRRSDRIVQAISADGSRILYDDTTGVLFVSPMGQANGVPVAPRTTSDAGSLSSLVRSQLSPRGDKVLFGRQSNAGTGAYDPTAGTLWVVDTDGANLRGVGSPISMVTSAVWDPSGRFIAYSGLEDSTTTVLRVVELATGVEHEFQVPVSKASLLRVVDWSADGKYIGVVLPEFRAEYWVVQGLLDAVGR